jgi:hypothetical protein
MISSEPLNDFINRVLTDIDPNIRIPGLNKLEKMSEDRPDLFDKSTVRIFFLNLRTFPFSPSEIKRLKRIFARISKNFDWDNLETKEIVENNSPVTIQIIFTIFPDFSIEKKKDCLPRLLELICRIDNSSEEYIEYKKSILSCDADILKKCLLDNIYRVDMTLFPIVDLMSNINGNDIIDSFIMIYNRLLDGEKYGGKYELIHQIILKYFITNNVLKCYDLLLQVFENKDVALINTPGFADTVAVLFNGNFVTLLSYLERNIDNATNFGVLINILNKMNEEQLKILDAFDLLKIVHKYENQFLARYWSELLFSKLIYNIIPILKKLYHGNEEEYRFARNVILLRKESVYDYDKSNPIPVINQVILDEIQHDRYKENRNIDTIMKSNLNNLKKEIHYDIDRFEFLIMNLLIYSRFITYFIDIEGTKGVDIIAISPQINSTLLIGCTTASISGDDSKLTDVYLSLSRKGLKMDFIPIIATPLQKKDIPNFKEISEKGIILLTKEKIDLIYEMALSNRPHNEIFEKICEKSF